MKKIISVFLTFIFLLTCVVIPASANEITSSTAGFTNIRFSNGYIGFCIDQKKSGSVSGDTFTPAASTSVADNNVDGSDISQQLKVMFTQGFNTLFTPDGNGSYHITSDTADSLLAFAIYHFTGEQTYIWGDIKTLVNMVNAYEGPDIPDNGYSLSLANGDIVTFSFMVLEPQKEGQQSFFAYKLNVSQEAPHEHDYSDDWKSDDKEHWHECECEDKTDIDEHSGNTADCVTPSKCTVCGKELAGVNSENHTGNTEIRNEKSATEFEDGYTGDIHCKDCGVLIENGKVIPATHEHDYSDDWKSDDKEHWHECECEDKTDIDEHSGNTADCVTPSKCTVCGKELAGVNSENHTGNTEIRNEKSATEFEDGYTGDIHCKDCGVLIENGKVIPATHEHNYSDDWKSDDKEHWHECECEDKTDIDEHSGNTADCVTPSKCTVCGKELAGVNSENHTGNTEIRNEKPATEFEDGYTGDIHCKDCGVLIENGKVIPATHEHDYSDDWKSDDKEHWHECECEDKTDIDEHSGNTADCVTPSKCTVCGKELAGVNSENHTGNTEIRNEKPATEFEDGYTGDIHCKDCGVLIEKGKVIPATHEHDYSDDWKSDDKEHWHECECEDKTDVDEHTYTDGVCSVCGKELSTDDPNGDDDIADNNNEDIIDIIIGLLGDIDFNVDTDEIKEALEEALAGLDINVSIDEITEYISNLDSKADIDKVISDLIDIIIGSDDNKPEGTPETDSDTESESDDGNTNSDTISPDTGVHNGVAVMIIILSLGIIAAFAAIICKKKYASA